jgi:hypothetical protein
MNAFIARGMAPFEETLPQATAGAPMQPSAMTSATFAAMLERAGELRLELNTEGTSWRPPSAPVNRVPQRWRF